MSEIPTVTMRGKKGLVNVNVSDVEEWRKKGYKLATEAYEPPASPAKGDKKDKQS